MKKLKIAVLLVFALTVLTACSCSKKEYLVEFDSNGGTKVQSQNVEKGGKVTKPEDPTKEGYSFARWELDGEKYDFDLEVTEDMVLVAKWNKKEPSKEEKPTEPVASVCTLTCDKGYALNTESCSCYKLTVTKVNVKATSVNLEIGSTYEIGASVYPSGVLNTGLTYSSDNEAVAKVDAKGTVTAVKPGKAVITVKSSDSGKMATVTITVLDDYKYRYEAVDGLDISYKIILIKNDTELTEAQAKEVYAVYNAADKYLGRYDESIKAIIVDKDQINSVAKIKLNNTTYNVKKAIIG